ncbi:MAG: amidase family protein, partial [Pseudomonadota bacterium]
MSLDEICFMEAIELTERLAARDLSAAEVMEAHLCRIERTNPRVNAIVTLLPDQAMEAAHEADRALIRGETGGPLFGIPMAHKDL